MEQIVWIFLAIAAIILLSSAISILTANRRGSSSKLSSSSIPLGNLGILPFIGETIQFISCAYSDKPETFINKRRLMYGKVFKSHLFGSPTIISTDAEVSRIILQSDANIFVPSYPKSLMELMGKSSILLVNGSLHRRMHGLIASFIKSPNLKAQITSDMHKYVIESMDKWNQDSPVFIQDEAKYAKKKMIELIHRIIQTKRENGQTSNPATDVADALVKDTNEYLTDDLIAENIIDLMIPGEDSVPVLITLAVKYLSDSPLALKQLTEENMKLKRVKEKLGEPLSWNDYMIALPFTRSVITETLRMGNIIIGVMRKAMKDVEIKGYHIPKGYCVMSYFRSVHLDDTLYESPYQFNPWRWHEAKGCVQGLTWLGWRLLSSFIILSPDSGNLRLLFFILYNCSLVVISHEMQKMSESRVYFNSRKGITPP
ncbi:hypothetical protein F511_18633 [Dorcoceras hygrometricum]|uniref:3-epi-6-deoxocathasterone 23-monooxygenase n=1 Tax=Dorcoceras hygrometricum TaxID=472368 RepID=A0A2Z7DG02_9LAMI|nr:hypothetical protein F511_18633 [Dorcoceras hygrometricum]